MVSQARLMMGEDAHVWDSSGISTKLKLDGLLVLEWKSVLPL